MTDKISKAVAKFTPKERKLVKEILLRLKDGDTSNFKISKLKGHPDVFRLKRGKLRIIYQQSGRKIQVLAIEHRSKTTYINY